VKKICVAILGATGLVGSKAIALLKHFPHLTLKEIATSEEHVGKEVQGLKAKRALDLESPYILSALPKEVAAEIEPSLLARGQHLFSNASTFRMKEDVPLLIPEINLPHLKLIKYQTTPGKLICNPNCMVALIAPLLAPFIKDITHVSIVTMQAISGAGKKYSLSNNIIPNIENEEEKIEKELRKILAPSLCSLAVHVNRVPIQDGHSAILYLHFRTKTSTEELKDAYAAQPQLYKLYEDPFSPQPGRDLSPLDPLIHIGRIQQREGVISLFGMTHNLVRGAALGSLLNLNAFLEREWS
jgi:aspartate-semialdehyde dehydrogenase